jgi:hypothetical protein
VGPGRPLVASTNARAVNSATRSGTIEPHRPLRHRAEQREMIDFLDRILADDGGVHVVDDRDDGDRTTPTPLRVRS